MTPEAITPLRQRMIEDMNIAQALCAHPARSHLQLQAVGCVSEALTRDGHMRGPSRFHFLQYFLFLRSLRQLGKFAAFLREFPVFCQ